MTRENHDKSGGLPSSSKIPAFANQREKARGYTSLPQEAYLSELALPFAVMSEVQLNEKTEKGEEK